MTRIGENRSLPTFVDDVSSSGHRTQLSERPAAKASGALHITDGFDIGALTRFTRFGDSERAGEPQRAGFDPKSSIFDLTLARRYEPATFEMWACIALIMKPVIEQLMTRLLQQLLGGSGGGADAGGTSGAGGTGPVITNTVPHAHDGARARYEEQTELFDRNGPSADDIQQGKLGDCYFLSTLAGVATEDPSVIRDNIKPHVDPQTGETAEHYYDVRFYEKDAAGNVQERWVTVDDSMLRDAQGNELYAGASDTDNDGKTEQWVALYEKAYAVFSSRSGNVDQGYDAIGQGGLGDEAYFAITGRNAEMGNPTRMDDRQLTDILSATNARNGPVVMLGSIGGDDSMLRADGIPGGHMYTVLGTYEDPATHETMVTIRNPWGCFEPGLVPDGNGGYYATEGFDGKNDGIFSIPLSQVQRDFDLVTYADDPRYNLSGFRNPALRA